MIAAPWPTAGLASRTSGTPEGPPVSGRVPRGTELLAGQLGQPPPLPVHRFVGQHALVILEVLPPVPGGVAVRAPLELADDPPLVLVPGRLEQVRRTVVAAALAVRARRRPDPNGRRDQQTSADSGHPAVRVRAAAVLHVDQRLAYRGGQRSGLAVAHPHLAVVPLEQRD